MAKKVSKEERGEKRMQGGGDGGVVDGYNGYEFKRA